MPQTLPPRHRWTVEDWRALSHERVRYEVLGGALVVSPAPRLAHQAILEQLGLVLHPFVATHRLGVVLRAPAEVAFGRHNVVQPDLFVAPLVAGRPPRSWEEIRRLVLAIEVLSPATALRDRTAKRALYQTYADDYWIVNLGKRVVERWRPRATDAEVHSELLAWHPAGAAAPLVLDLPSLFALVQGA